MLAPGLLLLLSLCSTSTSWGLQIPSSTRGRAVRSPMFAATADKSIPLSLTSSKKAEEFADFDYYNHWYPVMWMRDLPLNKPTKVTIFDVDYVVAKVKEHEVVAMLDRCPHKSAALSEGRITESGYFQCAYHGWSFDGKDGACVEIPQVVKESGEMGPVSSRARGTAVPAMIQQEMVYLFPGGNLEKALLASPPPIVPDLEEEGWKMTPAARDFPIDWAILLENIMDPDHGLFAHGQVGFDLYSASSDIPQLVEEERTENGGWIVKSSVDAQYKLLELNKRLVGAESKEEDKTKTGFLTFVAPTFAYYCRRDKETGETKFISSFYITPTGTGRSRFMTAVIYKAPFNLPRWVSIIGLNNFLDQDTYLLATQQQNVLLYEAEAAKKMTNPATYNSRVRRQHYAYRSPSEKLAVRVGAFWDATLSRAPNRVAALRKYDGMVPLAPRTDVLNREEQHLAICPDSQDLVRNCAFVEKWSRAVLWFSLAVKAYVSIVARGAWAVRVDNWLRPTMLISTCVVTSVVRKLAQRLRKEYYFKYTSDLRDRDLTNIPKVWRDKLP